MDQIEPIEIDSDTDSDNTAIIDKNHNIDKNVLCTTTTETVFVMASTSSSTANDQPTNPNLLPGVAGNPIIIYDSEDNCSQEANFASYGNQNDTDTKDDQSDADTVIKNEENKEVPKAQPIAARTRSSRRPNLVSYNEDEPSTSSTVDESKTISDFPKGPTKPRFQVDASQIPKNDDKLMFYSNFLYKSMCLLCGCSDKNLANHYARKHPETEVFISRLSPKMATRLRSEQVDFLHIDSKIHGFCFFCEEVKKMKMDNWKKHLLDHTGEQMYYCDGCQMSMARKANHGQCLKNKVQTTFEENESNDDLIGYICNTCNYLQIGKHRLDKHLMDEHDTYDDSYSELYSRIVLVQSPIV